MSKTYVELVVDAHQKIQVDAINELYEIGQAELGQEMTRNEADGVIRNVLVDMGFKPLTEMWEKVVEDAEA